MRVKLLRPIYYLALFLVLAPLLIYFFSQNPSGARAITTVGTSSNINATFSPSQRQIVQSSNGTILAFYVAGNEETTGLVFRKSTDNGANWSSATTVTTEATDDFSVAIDGNDHAYLAFAGSTGATVKVIKLTHSAGTWSVGAENDVFTIDSCNLGFDNGYYYQSPTIVVNSSNKIWVSASRLLLASLDCEGGSYEIVTSSSTTAASWTANGAVISLNIGSGHPMFAIGDVLWMTVPDSGTNGGIWKDATSSGSWTQITASTVFSAGISLTSAGSDQLDLFYKNASNALVYRKYTISTTTLGSEVTLSSDTNDSLGTISANATTGHLWAFYRDFVAANSGNVVYKKYNGTSWDGSATGITTDNLNNTSISSVANRAGASYIPLIWSVGTASPYTVKSEVLSIGGGSSPAAPTLINPANSATGVRHLPHFQLRATDADGDYLRYKIEVCSTNTCSSIVRTIDQTASQTGWSGQDLQTATAYTGSATLTSSTIAQHDYQPAPLADSTQYWWRAYAIDPGGSNTFSGASSISTFTTSAAQPLQIRSNTTIRGGTKVN